MASRGELTAKTRLTSLDSFSEAVRSALRRNGFTEWSLAKSSSKGKKWTIRLVKADGTQKLVHFGATGYPDYRQLVKEAGDDPAKLAEAKQRRKQFRSRFAQLIKDTKKDPTSPMFWSYHLLW